jgi:hypothetical protein
MISLSQAITEGRMPEFVDQEEKRGVGPADPAELDDALSRVIKGEKSADQTSRSASRDGSSGK